MNSIPCLSIGHFLQFPASICLIGTLYRTLFSVSRFRLSDRDLLSDSFFGFMLLFVRQGPSIGHFLQFHASVCPIGTFYRTLSSVSCFCLSNRDLLSDTFFSFMLPFVRQGPSIGHFLRFHASVCPIGTLLGHFLRFPTLGWPIEVHENKKTPAASSCHRCPENTWGSSH